MLYKREEPAFHYDKPNMEAFKEGNMEAFKEGHKGNESTCVDHNHQCDKMNCSCEEEGGHIGGNSCENEKRDGAKGDENIGGNSCQNEKRNGDDEEEGGENVGGNSSDDFDENEHRFYQHGSVGAQQGVGASYDKEEQREEALGQCDDESNDGYEQHKEEAVAQGEGDEKGYEEYQQQREGAQSRHDGAREGAPQACPLQSRNVGSNEGDLVGKEEEEGLQAWTLQSRNVGNKEGDFVVKEEEEGEGKEKGGLQAWTLQSRHDDGAREGDFGREGDACPPLPSSRHDDDGSKEGEFVERVTIDELLRKWVGEFGRAQIVHFTLTSLAWALEALHTLVTIFADKTPPWKCITIDNYTPNHLSFTNHNHYLNNYTLNHLSFTVNNNNNNNNNDSNQLNSFNSYGYIGSLLQQNFSDATSIHHVCTPSSSLCSLAPSLWEWVRKDESTISEWDLVCQTGYVQGLAQSAFFIGCLLGAGLFGHLSDSRLGRRGALGLACILNAVCGMLTAAAPNYGVYTLLRAATGVCSGGLGLTSFVLSTEFIGPSHRTIAAMCALYFYPLGTLLLAGLAASASHYSWRILYLITSAPSVFYCFFILPFLAESPRWYLVRGHTQKALQVLKSFAKKNGVILPEGVVLFMEEQDDDDNEHTRDHRHYADNKDSTAAPQQPIPIADGSAIREESNLQQFNTTPPRLHDGTRSEQEGFHLLPRHFPGKAGSEPRDIRASVPLLVMHDGLELRGIDESTKQLPVKSGSELQGTTTVLPLPPHNGEQQRKIDVLLHPHIVNGLDLRRMSMSPPKCQPGKNGLTRNGLHSLPTTTNRLEFKEINERLKVTDGSHIAEKVKCKAASGTLMDVFKRDDTRMRMVILVVVWFACALGYYAFNLNVGNLGTNLTRNVVLNALAEIPGYAIATYLLHRVGRRITLISALFLSAFSTLLGAIVSYQLNPHTSNTLHWATPTFPSYNTNITHALASYNTTTYHHDSFLTSKALQLRSSIQLACELLGLFSIAGTYNLLYLYTAELFPTVVRNVALGLANQAGALGSIIAPTVVLSAHVNTTFPFFIIGAVSLLSAIMAIKLPETLNRPFHETFEGMQRANDQEAA